MLDGLCRQGCPLKAVASSNSPHKLLCWTPPSWLCKETLPGSPGDLHTSKRCSWPGCAGMHHHHGCCGHAQVVAM